MARVLLYNFMDEARRKKVKAALFRCALPSREVSPEEQDQPIGVLLGMPGYEKELLPEELLGKPEELLGEAEELLGEPEERPQEEQSKEIPEKNSGRSAPFTEEMIVMQDLSPRQFHGFLDGLKAAGIRVPLKAVVTEHNAGWSSGRLCRELKAEHEAMQAGSRIHE